MEEEKDVDNNKNTDNNNFPQELNTEKSNLNNQTNKEKKIDGKIALNNLMERNKGYLQIYNLLYGIKNKNEEKRNNTTQKKQTKQKNNRPEYNPIVSNMEALRKSQKSKLYDYKISMLYGRIQSLQKESNRRAKSIYKYPNKNNDKKNSLLNTAYNNNDDIYKSTPFQKYKFETKNNIEIQPLKLYKNFFNKNNNFYQNNNNNNNNLLSYKYTFTSPNLLNPLDSIDNWINREKLYQKNSFYNEKTNEINNLVNNTRNTNENQRYFKFPIYNSYDNLNFNNYSGDYFKKELNRFSSLLRSTDNNRRILKKI